MPHFSLLGRFYPKSAPKFPGISAPPKMGVFFLSLSSRSIFPLPSFSLLEASFSGVPLQPPAGDSPFFLRSSARSPCEHLRWIGRDFTANLEVSHRKCFTDLKNAAIAAISAASSDFGGGSSVFTDLRGSI